MAGLPGRGHMNLTFNAQAVPGITSMELTNSAEEITTETADGTLKDSGSASWRLVVQFVYPATASHTLEGNLKANEEGAATFDIGITRYTVTTAKSLGISKSGSPSSHVAGSLTLVWDGDPSMAAAT